MLPISNIANPHENAESQNFLTLNKNSMCLEHAYIDTSSSQYNGSRNSSVSINIPDNKEGLYPNHLLPPQDPCSSRLSTSSAWNSIRHSALSISRVFFLKPCSRHKCCLGCISLRDAIPLICSVEIFFLVFSVFIAVDFWLGNGKTFYTTNFEGYGREIALGYFGFFLFSVLIILFTLFVWKKKQRNWYVVHVIWQWTVIEIFGFFIYMVMNWICSENMDHHSILLPSAMVLIGITSCGALVELWWLIIFVDAMLFEGSSGSYGSRRNSHENENRDDLESVLSESPTTVRPVIKITENLMTPTSISISKTDF